MTDRLRGGGGADRPLEGRGGGGADRLSAKARGAALKMRAARRRIRLSEKARGASGSLQKRAVRWRGGGGDRPGVGGA